MFSQLSSSGEQNKGLVLWIVTTFVTGSISFASEKRLPEVRVWNSKSGHSLKARLVWFSDYEVALMGADNRVKTIDVEALAVEDLRYARTFVELKKEKPPSKLPFVMIDGTLNHRGATGFFSRSGRSNVGRRSFFIEVESRHNKPIEVDVVWSYFAERVSGAYIRTRSREDLYTIAGDAVKFTLDAGKSVKLDTGIVSIRSSVSGGRNRLVGVVAQVYWNGFLIDGFSSHHLLSDMAEDGGLLERDGNERR